MADVDTVKIADGQSARRSCLGIGKSAEYLHRNLMKNCAKRGIIRTVSGMHTRQGGRRGNFPAEMIKSVAGKGAGNALDLTQCTLNVEAKRSERQRFVAEKRNRTVVR
ncbi:hypothetical protein [Janthinobacterium sp. LB2P70]|uniref:hypothetical protein n=1 Tax=Janthinobacterium sp. LB2P70 TaxID=3424197 RepID=UPI003F278F9F